MISRSEIYSEQDSTIAAISTPYGRGGVSVIRISGSTAIEISEKIFKPKSGKNLAGYAPRTSVYGDIYQVSDDSSGIIDDGLAVYFKAPNSYTGEDIVEISCHGGILLTQTVLESIFVCGAVPARAGEFTQRAFLAGKLGLTRAEAVIDLIDAESTEKLRLSAAQSRGILSTEITELYEEMRILVSSVYVYIDFPDEDLSDVPNDEFRTRLAGLKSRIKKLCDTYRTGRAVNEGISTCIAGKPNVGKSSLLNILLGRNRAIVTNIAGTTRDVIEESVNIGKIILRLSDTAGIRDTSDKIEQMGVSLALENMRQADLVLAVFDGASELDSDDMSLIDRLCTISAPVIVLINKSDLTGRLDTNLLQSKLVGKKAINISANDGNGLDELKNEINNMFTDSKIDYNVDAVVTNARQYSSLHEANCALERAEAALDGGFTPDVAGLDLEYAMSRLAEIDGRAVTDDVVSSIFHRFCVGK